MFGSGFDVRGQVRLSLRVTVGGGIGDVHGNHEGSGARTWLGLGLGVR